MSLIINPSGVAPRSTLLHSDTDPNQSSVLGSAVLGGRSNPSVRLGFLRVAFVASADVGTRSLRMKILDAAGDVRHARSLGSVVASGTLDLSMPFNYPAPKLTDAEDFFPAVALPVSGTVNATLAATNVVVGAALDLPLELFAEEAPAAYPVPRGTRVYGVSAVVVKDITEVTTYVLDTDYTLDAVNGTITPLGTGAISALDDLVVDFAFASTVINGVGQKHEPFILLPTWTVVVEDQADIEGTNDVLVVEFHGLHSTPGRATRS